MLHTHRDKRSDIEREREKEKEKVRGGKERERKKGVANCDHPIDDSHSPNRPFAQGLNRPAIANNRGLYVDQRNASRSRTTAKKPRSLQRKASTCTSLLLAIPLATFPLTPSLFPIIQAQFDLLRQSETPHLMKIVRSALFLIARNSEAIGRKDTEE